MGLYTNLLKKTLDPKYLLNLQLVQFLHKLPDLCEKDFA